MSEEQRKTSYNIIKQRGSPTEAITLTGHHVTKKDEVLIPSPFDNTQMMFVRCADYHMEHFVYVDPNFEKELPEDEDKQYWFAMCTCGSPAVIIGGEDVSIHEGHNWLQDILSNMGGPPPNMLVCQAYMTTLKMHGHGYHQGQGKRKWA